MKNTVLTLLGLFFSFPLLSQHQTLIPFEQDSNRTVKYEEAIAAYQRLAVTFPKMFQLEVVGQTDSGTPLHVGILSKNGMFDPQKAKAADKRIILINNGIHPGEPEGIDATILLFRDLLDGKIDQSVLDNLVVLAIPIYNIGGALNRNRHSRTNQNGPESYGFRGNAKNLDLNRDFIKCDSKNAESFTRLFHRWQPDVFIDNHTSNGADYQHVMTLIPTQHNKLTEPLGSYLDGKMVPQFFEKMKEKGYPMAPYVETLKSIPDSGIVAFLDYPRYSSGYAALWNCLSFIPETHMLKPFSERLKSTYALMEVIFDFVNTHHSEIKALRAAAAAHKPAEIDLDWDCDFSKMDKVPFLGFAAKYKTSKVTGQQRLWYDRGEPWEAEIPYFNTYKSTKTRRVPRFYVLPQAWEAVVQRLQWNGVEMQRFEKDTSLELTTYFITKYKDRTAYEGHYLHYEIEVESRTETHSVRKGDFLIPTDQAARKFLLNTLEPDAPDSYFAWNFFDPILMQKEWFSPYVFEDIAADFLEKNPKIRADLEEKKQNEPEFSKNAWTQLYWVYQKTEHYEKAHLQYPVKRIE